MVLLSACIYYISNSGIRSLVKQYKLSMPNRKASRINFLNTSSLVSTEIAAAASIKVSYGKVNERIPYNETDVYLKSTLYESSLLLLCFVLETIASLIADYLKVSYARNEKSKLRQDPITGQKVPSLIFVYNQ